MKFSLFLCFSLAVAAQTTQPVLRQLPPMPNLTVLGNISGATAVPGPLAAANLMVILSGAPASATSLGVVQCDGITITCTTQGVITAVPTTGSGVGSFNTRTGSVVSTLGDYTFAMITGNFTLGQFPTIPALTILGNSGGTASVPSALTPSDLITVIGNGAPPSLVAGTNVTITGTWPNQTITASTTGGVAFSGLTGSTNTSAAMLIGSGASLGTTGTGTNSATAINGTALGGLTTGILKNTTTTGVPSIAIAADFPTLNQSTTGNATTATTATNVAGGVQGSVPYQSGANTSVFVAPNTAATDQVLISHGTGTVGQAPTFSNAPALSAANMASFPTLNQSTSGNAATATALASTPALCSTGSAPTGILASGTATGCAAIPQGTITALTTDVTASGTGSVAATVKGINGTLMSGLATGILKNTTTTGVPSIAVAGDFPTLNQNTSGTAAGLSATLGVTTGGTGLASYTPYAVVAGGTTGIASLQQVSGLGSANQVLTSNGASALPTWQNATGAVAFNGITAGTNTTAAMVVGSGGSLAATGTGSISATALSPFTTLGDLPYGGTSGALTRLAGSTSATKNFLTQTGNGTVSAAPSWGTIAVGDVPTLNQSTTGNALTATTSTNVAGGVIGSIPYQSAAATTAMLTGNSAATDQAVISHGTGSAALAPTLANAPALSAANMTSFPTLNQNTSGTAAGLSATLAVGSGGSGIATTTPYALLAAGTTATGAFQQVSGLGSSTQVLTSNGAGALPTWQNSAAGSAFSGITGSTNTTAAMVVGSGASLATSGTGTVSATALNGTALSGLSTGLLKNTTTTGVPSIATAGTDYPGLSSTNSFSGSNTFTNGATASTLTAGIVGTATGSLSLLGTTSGSAAISVAAAAGTPNTMQLPTATAGASGAVLTSNAANPQVLSWTSILPVANGGTGTSSALTLPWSSLTAASSPLTLANGANNTTIQNTTSLASLTLNNVTNATSGVNQSSVALNLVGHAWEGGSPATTTDSWTLQNVFANGSNPAATLRMTNSNTSTTTPAVAIADTVAATLGQAQSSPFFNLVGQGWEGGTPANATDTWSFQNLLANGANPAPTLRITNTTSSTALPILSIPANLTLNGGSSGSAALMVAAAAGTPNAIQLPTATAGATGAVLTSNAGNPQVTSWTTSVPVANGGTGLATTTAYGLMAAGTTATGNFQQVSGTGSSGNVLTSAGAGALPTWAAPTFSGLAGSTNTTAAMVVGSGATLGATGTGTITATNYTDFPDRKYFPAANCNAGTPGNGWTLPAASAPTVTCFTGTNVLDGYLAYADTGTAQFSVLIPDDWDSASSVDLKLFFTDASTSGTVIFKSTASCTPVGGTVVNDQAFNTEQNYGTITLSTPASAAWATTLTGLTKTGCAAGNMMHIKVSRSTDTAAGVANVSGAQLTLRRNL